MPSTQFHRDAKSSGALLDLHRRIGVGQEFPDACATVAQLFGVDHDELRQAYDRACRELASACRGVAGARNLEQLEGMLVLDIEVGDQADMRHPSFSELEAQRPAS